MKVTIDNDDCGTDDFGVGDLVLDELNIISIITELHVDNWDVKLFALNDGCIKSECRWKNISFLKKVVGRVILENE